MTSSIKKKNSEKITYVAKFSFLRYVEERIYGGWQKLSRNCIVALANELYCRVKKDFYYTFRIVNIKAIKFRNLSFHFFCVLLILRAIDIYNLSTQLLGSLLYIYSNSNFLRRIVTWNILTEKLFHPRSQHSFSTSRFFCNSPKNQLKN